MKILLKRIILYLIKDRVLEINLDLQLDIL